MEGDIERCPTGIDGFDAICQGGFVRNSSNVIVGGPGSGKTTFLLQFLWIGATKFEENGLYCSFEPDIVEVLSDARWFGWDFSKLAQEGRVQFLKFSPQTSINELRGELTKLISKHNIKRICFDPVSVLALNLSESGKIREVIFDLVSLMKRLNVTSILADESFEAENPKKLIELTDDTCRWPIGHPYEKDFYFCGRKPLDKFPYCKLHVLYAFQPKNAKEEDIVTEEDVPQFIEKKIKSA